VVVVAIPLVTTAFAMGAFASSSTMPLTLAVTCAASFTTPPVGLEGVGSGVTGISVRLQPAVKNNAAIKIETNILCKKKFFKV
jgi:hypothetical protein